MLHSTLEICSWQGILRIFILRFPICLKKAWLNVLVSVRNVFIIFRLLCQSYAYILVFFAVSQLDYIILY